MKLPIGKLVLAAGQAGRLEEVIAEAIRHCQVETGADGASLLLLDEATGELTFSVLSDPSVVTRSWPAGPRRARAARCSPRQARRSPPATCP